MSASQNALSVLDSAIISSTSTLVSGTTAPVSHATSTSASLESSSTPEPTSTSVPSSQTSHTVSLATSTEGLATPTRKISSIASNIVAGPAWQSNGLTGAEIASIGIGITAGLIISFFGLVYLITSVQRRNHQMSEKKGGAYQ